MNCMKCGRQIADGQVFCESCLDAMNQFPVKPGTAVQLPQRPAEPAVKRTVARKKAPTPAEQVPRLRKTIRRMGFCIGLLLLALALVTAGLLRSLRLQSGENPIGKNYSTIGHIGGS